MVFYSPNPVTAQTNQTTNQTLSENDFANIREQYLSSLENVEFQSIKDVFIEIDLFDLEDDVGYGIYNEKTSNVYEPGEDIILYVEPVGFDYESASDRLGNELYQVNLTATIILSDETGEVVMQTEEREVLSVYSKNKVTEIFLTLPLKQDTSLSVGEYHIIYLITDGVTGDILEITKPIRILEVIDEF